MAEVREYTVRRSVKGARYRSLIRALAQMAVEFGMIVEIPVKSADEPIAELLARLAPYLTFSGVVHEWPGSQILSGLAGDVLLKFRVTPETVREVVDAANSLPEWVNPYLPQDLHMLRADGTVVLGNIATHRDVWVELDDTEYALVTQSLEEYLTSRTKQHGMSIAKKNRSSSGGAARAYLRELP